MPTKTRKRSGKKRVTSDQIYQQVTDTIIAALEEGTVPWHRPWRVDGGTHINMKSKKSYRGVNQFLLDFEASIRGYSSPYWMSFKQIKEMGGHLKKINGADEDGTGQKSTLVVFWKVTKLEKKDSNGNPVKDKDGNDVKINLPLLKYYRVFNVEQTEGIEDKIPVIEQPEDFTPIDAAQHIIDSMPQRPTIRHSGDRAVYSPLIDSVTLPTKGQFDTPEDYYCTAYHELVHSTGHESRTGRVKDWAHFGSEPYSKEELVAEMGAAMLGGFANIDIPTKNTAAYIKNWLQRLQEDNKLVVQAASKAQQAADFILGTTFEEND